MCFFRVRDGVGRVVMERRGDVGVGDGLFLFDVLGFGSGMYFLEVAWKGRILLCKKMVKL